MTENDADGVSVPEMILGVVLIGTVIFGAMAAVKWQNDQTSSAPSGMVDFVANNDGDVSLVGTTTSYHYKPKPIGDFYQECSEKARALFGDHYTLKIGSGGRDCWIEPLQTL